MMAEVVVIGAGLIGLSSAYYLLADGHRVTVIDRDPAGDKASFGNAGGIGVSEIVPAAVPGLIWRVPGWLVDPLGPLSLRPQHLPALIPWLWRFLRSGRRSEIPRITAALAAIADHTYDDLVPLMAAIGLAGDLHMAGAMSVYETREGFERDRPEWALKQRFGTICEEIGGDEARAREPALGPIVKHAIVTPQWAHVSDPKRIVDRLRDHVAARGARIVRGEAAGIEPQALRTADGRRHAFDALVIAAGAWSGRLAALVGDRVLLESERGYNTTLPDPGITLNAEVIFAERKFVATPLEMGLRIGGAAEFAGLEAPANYARSRALLTLAQRYFPALKGDGGTMWMGHRPTTPDSLPVIGRSPRRGNVFYAFGHAHTGLTFGPTTGRLIAELVGGRPPSLDLSPYSIARFA
jgi:D-amino-acid dehydrogenase